MIRFSCECGQQLQARDEHAGKVVVCPKCKQQARIPAAPPTSFHPEEPPEQAPPSDHVQRERPALRNEVGEPRPHANSGKALASLVLGILSFCGCSCLTGLPALALGFLSLLDISKAAGTLTGKPLAFIGMVLGSIGTLCLPIGYYFGGQAAWSRVRESAYKAESKNNLRQMAIAMHNYHETYNVFPSTNIPPRMGRPGFGQPAKPHLSWRVALLPYLEQINLYNQFNHEEPWDGPNNKKLLEKIPKIYQIPGDDIQPGYTRYQVFVGNGAAFDPLGPLRIVDFRDGSSNTILIVEAEKPVPWTKPEDIPFEPGKPIRPLLSTHFRDGCNIVMADGFPRIVTPDVPENTLHAAITRGAGDIANWP